MFSRIMFTIHRVLGTLLSVLFLMWFVSGIVMIYHGFPSAGRDEKAAKLEPLDTDLPSVDELARRLPDTCTIDELSVSRYLGQTVYEIRSGKETFRLPADSAEQLPVIDGAYIARVAALWCSAPVSRIDSLHALDQWIPFGRLKEEFPIYKFHFADHDGTELYISSRSGEVLQYTTRSERFWAWVGAVPHWVYFTLLRQDRELWIKTVIWLSGVGAIMVIAGLYVGIYVSVKSRRRKKKWFPYKKKWYYWHHVTGIVFGLFALTWVFSGMMSLADPPEWLVKEHQKYPVRQTMEALAPSPAAYPLDYKALISQYDGRAIEIRWSHFFGLPTYEIVLSGVERLTIDATTAQPLALTEAQATEAVRRIHGDDAVIRTEQLNEYDTYYLDRKRRLELPVWKVSVENEDRSCYYITPSNGRLREYNTRRRTHFWMYSALHALRFKFLTEHPVLWTTVMWMLLLGGAFVSLSGVVLGVKYIVRLFRRKARRTAGHK